MQGSSNVRSSPRATSTSPPAGTPTIDGKALAVGDWVLLVGQSNASECGVWIVAPGGWTTRPPEANDQQDFLGMTIVVREGDVHADTMWQCLNDPTVTVGTTPLAFAPLPGVVDKALLP